MGKMTTRRKALAVEAVNPQDGKPMVVMFDQRKLLACRDRSQGQLKEAAYTVPMILQHPKAIFGGLLREADEPKRPQEEGWLCYCGVPETAFAQDGTETTP